MKKTLFSVFAAFVLLLCSCSVEYRGALTTSDGTEVVPQDFLFINGVSVDWREYRSYYLTMKETLESGQEKIWENENNCQMLKNKVLDSLKYPYAIRSMAASLGIEPDKGRLDELYDEAVAEYSSEAEMLEALEETYCSEETYRYMLEATVLYGQIYDYYFSSGAQMEITDETFPDYLAEYYRRAAHIMMFINTDEELSDTRARLADVLLRVRNGEDFIALADEYNQSEDSEYHYVKGLFPENFEAVVEALPEGEVSEIVEDAQGFQIIKRLPLDGEYISANKQQIIKEISTVILEEMISVEFDALTVETTELYSDISPQSVK